MRTIVITLGDKKRLNLLDSAMSESGLTESGLAPSGVEYFDANPLRPHADEGSALFRQGWPSIGTLGCYRSHRAVWADSATKSQNTLILEDDAIFRPNAGYFLDLVIKNLLLLRDWHICQLGVHIPPTAAIAEGGPRRLTSNLMTVPFCVFLHAYIVTPHGAQHLLDGSRNQVGHIDRIINRIPGLIRVISTPTIASQRTLPSAITSGSPNREAKTYGWKTFEK